MILAQQVLFFITLCVTTYFIFGRIATIRNTILLGKPETRTDQSGKRLGVMIRVAFGQKKMFDKPVVGMLHFAVYAGFLLINLEVLEIVIDGLFGTHRIFFPVFGSFYSGLIGFFELLAVSVIVACTVFLVRRRILGIGRLQPSTHAEMKGWPQMDATIILELEIVLMTAILTMNAADSVLQGMEAEHYTKSGSFLISQFLQPIFSGWAESRLIVYERLAWWLHILGIFGFAVFVTYSKHLHIVLAFPNTYFSKLTPVGEMNNMPEITREVKSMLGLEPVVETDNTVPDRFGAKDIGDLSWKSLMDAYSCTECGRCTASCPANLTGKLLSPRKIMMDTRDRLEDVGMILKTNKGAFVDDGKSLLGNYISEEELLACTSCNACVEACPILINPLDIIFQLRRYKIMDEAQAPTSWNMMFQNLETNQAPWKFSTGDRFNWADKLAKNDQKG